MQSARLFTEERDVILDPLKAHRRRLIQDKEEFEPMTRASDILLTAEEPSIRTYFCARNVVMEFIRNHPEDPRGYKELGKVHLYSCVSENIDLAEEAFQTVQSLSGHIDAEAWYLISMCHWIRLFGCGSINNGSSHTSNKQPTADKSVTQQRKYSRLAEKGLKLALKHSNGSSVYRFALSDFYTSTNRLSKALSTLQAGLSASHQSRTDAAIFHQLGRFGISCIAGLQERGGPGRAKQVAMGALQYYRQALDIARNLDLHPHEWTTELANAQAIVDRLIEETSDIADFSTEPDFNPCGPISLRRWLTSSPVCTDDHPHPEDRPPSSPSSSQPSNDFSSSRQFVSTTMRSKDRLDEDRLTAFLDRIENQAPTYHTDPSCPDPLLFEKHFARPPSSSLQDPRLTLSPAGPSMTSPRRKQNCLQSALNSPTSMFPDSIPSPLAEHILPKKNHSRPPRHPVSHHSGSSQSFGNDQELLNDNDELGMSSPSCTCSN